VEQAAYGTDDLSIKSLLKTHLFRAAFSGEDWTMWSALSESCIWIKRYINFIIILLYMVVLVSLRQSLLMSNCSKPTFPSPPTGGISIHTLQCYSDAEAHVINGLSWPLSCAPPADGIRNPLAKRKIVSLKAYVEYATFDYFIFHEYYFLRKDRALICNYGSV
jgi:hypothetical protein